MNTKFFQGITFIALSSVMFDVAHKTVTFVFAGLLGFTGAIEAFKALLGNSSKKIVPVLICLPLFGFSQSAWLMKTTDRPVKKVYNVDFYQEEEVDQQGRAHAMLYVGWDETPLTALGMPTCQSWAFEPTTTDVDNTNVLQNCQVTPGKTEKWSCKKLQIYAGPDGDPTRLVLWREDQDGIITLCEWWKIPRP